MKKLLPLALCLCLLLSACGKTGGDAAKAFDPDQAAQAVVDSGCFSSEPAELDVKLLCDFDGYGLDASALTASKACAVPGLTEQVAVLVWKDADTAKASMDVFKTYIDDLKETYKSYAPNEIPKLDDAILVQRDNSILLVVAADAAKAQAAVDKL